MRYRLLVVVEDSPFVLNRVTLLLRRRGFHIESLTFARTSEPHVSRITVVIDADADRVHRLTAYLKRLVEVVEVRLA